MRRAPPANTRPPAAGRANSSPPPSPRSWWTQLYRESPTHVVIETTLIIAMLYILLVKRTYDPTKRCGRAGLRLVAGKERLMMREG